MGSLCCCFHVPDVEHDSDANGSCICCKFCIQNLINKFGSLFGRIEQPVVPSSNQGAALSNSTVALSNSSGTNRSNAGPLPNISGSGYSQLQQNVVVRRHEKGSSQSRVEPEPLGESNVQVIPKLLRGLDIPVGSPVKVLSVKVDSRVVHIYNSSEDEDVCPTCLEEYTTENPKIIAQCSHHYHLGCIYEWMERSETCPVCGKLMVFNETT